MYYAPVTRPPQSAHALPLPRPAIARQMVALSVAIDGSVGSGPSGVDHLLNGCLLMLRAGVLIAGTACHRPLLFDEAEAIAHETGLDLLLVRHDAYKITIDIRLQHMNRWLCHYRRWQREGDLWLVPDAADGPFVRATFHGLELGHIAPFVDDADLEAGLATHADPVFGGKA